MIEIDLLPETLRQRPGSGAGGIQAPGRLRLDLLSLALWISLLTVPPAVLSLWWTQRAEGLELEARLEAASADSATFASLRAASDSLAARFRDIGERIALVERIDRDRFAWPHMLDEISRALPSSAWLLSLRQLAPPPELAIELQGVAANPLAITEFVHSLAASDHIADVKILGSQQQGLDPRDTPRQTFTLILEAAAGERVARTTPTGRQH